MLTQITVEYEDEMTLIKTIKDGLMLAVIHSGGKINVTEDIYFINLAAYNELIDSCCNICEQTHFGLTHANTGK